MGWFLALPRLVRHSVIAAAAALLLGSAWAAWLQFHDKTVVDDHETEMRAKVTQAELEAERTANRRDLARRAARETRTEALKQAREHAIDEHPDETRVVAGPAVRAVLRELRTQAGKDRSAAR